VIEGEWPGEALVGGALGLGLALVGGLLGGVGGELVVVGVVVPGFGAGGGVVGFSMGGRMRVAPNSRDHETGEILTTSPVVGATTMRPSPM
jgi:hypothetical protein